MAPKHIVIVGAGIIGCTTAYYLSRHPAIATKSQPSDSTSPSSVGPTQITIVEASKVGPAQGASGKAGGLVARWAKPEGLACLSFEEHVRLAEEFGGAERWGWRLIEVGEWRGRVDGQNGILEQVSGEGASKEKVRKGLPSDLTWVNDQLMDSYTPIVAARGDSAQVHPYLFTTSMLELAIQNGVEFIPGRVTSLEMIAERVTGVQYIPVSVDGDASMEFEVKTLEADCIILAAGPWSPALLPSLPIAAVRGHSIIISPPSPPVSAAVTLSPHGLFTSIALPSPTSDSSRLETTTVTPEIYPRPDSTIYVCGPGDTRVPLPASVDEVLVDQSACEDIWKWVAEPRDGGIIRSEVLGEVISRQCCYVPIVKRSSSTGDADPDGPIIGTISGVEGLVVAAGHNFWVSTFRRRVCALLSRRWVTEILAILL